MMGVSDVYEPQTLELLVRRAAESLGMFCLGTVIGFVFVLWFLWRRNARKAVREEGMP